ncbi:GPI transamidase component Gpi16 [Ascosphaera apis ARSEF 7405]|uniref:GPI transamidase component Gpi16 n=1 Tax=Ascosphaera apis ARSEF 7405 TaxID=392613 RepID=A0A167X3L0_9EURO|nr:GPI transamidase component Gpi16 [Ascosphaera apis ARSEF 7405]
MSVLSFSWLCVVLSWLLSVVTAHSDYQEKLDLRPLPPSSLLASFNFKSEAPISSFESQNFRFFPRSLGQILQHADTKELHLRFTTGRWDAESWGERPWHGSKEGGTGVELWAWIEADDSELAFAKWTTLTQSLSGLFCASLNFIDSTRTTRPVVTFQSQGNHSATDNLHLLHGVLPGEVVCTENLTPLLKLLPCKGKAGISSLFDGHKIFDAAWQSMSIDVQPKCSKGQEECQIGIEETVDVVLDIERSKRPRANPIPRPVPVEELECDQSKGYNSPDVCYPVATTLDKGWELSEVFGRKIPGSCPLTDQTKIVCLHVPDSREVLTSALAYEELEADGLSRCYSLPFEFPFDLELPPQDENTYVPLQKPTLYAERTIIGHGQERGGMRSILINPSPDKSLEFVYFESLPWFLRPYLHTLRATVTDNSGTVQNIALSDIVKDIFYRPAVDRHRGTQLELILSIPAASTVTLIYDFEKTILRYTEYPPDANRGFYVAPAVIRVLSEGDRPIYLRTTSLLLALPTPDFSMPYNVIILTSTVMALAFGSIFNMLVRRLVTADEAKAASIVPKLKSKLVVLKDKIRGKSTKTK